MSDIKNKPVVVDTNVIISGLFGPASSYPSMIVGAWRAHRFCVAISHELLDELSRVFQKPRFIKLLEPHAIATAALDVMIKKSILISPQKLTKVYFSDDDADGLMTLQHPDALASLWPSVGLDICLDKAAAKLGAFGKTPFDKYDDPLANAKANASHCTTLK